MTAKQLLQWVEAYFGSYNKIQRVEMEHYLSKFHEEYIEALKEELKLAFSPTSTKPAPLVADLEEIKGDAEDRLEHIRMRRRAIDHNNRKQKAIEDARGGEREEDYRAEIVNLFEGLIKDLKTGKIKEKAK